ncbi:MAG: hypothetical protein NVSMB64_31300 [Candidatus Velthaea sp.]
MNFSESDQYESKSKNTIAATFDSREAAHDAAQRLHDQGFHGAWIGLTKPMHGDGGGDRYTGATTATAGDTTAVESGNWFQRLLGEGDETLHDALVRHGVREADFTSIGPVAPGSAILTIDGMNHPELAAEIISECDGEVITSGATERGFAFDDADISSAPDYTNYGQYRGGEAIDEARRLELREERLRISKESVSRGEATVGTEVVTQHESIDVPVMHEELYIERRPVSGSAVNAGEIGDGETIHVPLREERVNVTKTPVVTEEIVVGKREIEDTQHVSETTRREQLTVNDPSTSRLGARATEDRL